MASLPDRPPPAGLPVAPPPLEHQAPFRLDRAPPPPPSPFAPAFKGFDRLATAITYLVAASIAFNVVDVVLEAYLIRVLGRTPLFGGFPRSASTVYDVTVVIVGLDLLLWLVAGICVMVLFKRMMDNGAVIAPAWAEHKSYWAIWGWIIPILGLFRPYQVVRQIWQTSLCGDPETDRRPLPTVTKVWWGLFIMSNSSAFGFPTVPADGTATTDDFRAEAIGQLVGSVAGIALGVTFLLVLSKMVERHRQAVAVRA